MTIKNIFKNYGLSIVLAIGFVSTWILQFIFQFLKVSQEAIDKGKQFLWTDFWPDFFTSTFENWQSEFLQLLTFVVLTSFLIHKNSAESRDGADRAEKKIDRIINLLENREKDKNK